MTKVREITAERLAQAWATIPQVTQFDKADITSLEKWRAAYGKKAEAAGGKLTPTAILIKVLGIALKVFPQFNASIDIAQREVVYKSYFHIGIAVDTPPRPARASRARRGSKEHHRIGSRTERTG